MKTPTTTRQPRSPITHYKLVHATNQDVLTLNVQSLLDQGWIIWGSLHNVSPPLIQPMIKRTPSESTDSQPPNP